MNRYILTILVLICSTLTLIAQFDQSKVNKVDELVRACAEYGQFNGSVLVADHDGVIYKNGVGMANWEWEVPNKSDTKFRLASISKQFTALLIVQLAAEGKLKLDDPISHFLPDYPNATGDKVTVHHLLTHSSGIPNYTSFDNYRDIMPTHMQPMELVKMFADSTLEFTPGSEFAYSNSGYVLLGVILEKVSGQTYADALQSKIFEPLSMINSGYDTHRAVLKNRATGYNKVGNKYDNSAYIDMSIPYAAGAIYSTVEDLYLWDRGLYTDKLLPKKYRDILFQEHMPAWGSYYGYGWEVKNMSIGNTKDHVATVGHGGGINGFNTLITRIPSEKSVILLLNNTSGAPLNDMTSAIIGILHDKTYTFPKRSLALTLTDAIEKDGLTNALDYYETIKQSDDYQRNENEMNMAGYLFLQSGKIDEAAAIFKLNMDAYPNSFNVYDSYGEAKLMLGDTTKAIEMYKQSVILNPDNTNGVDVLRNLGVDASKFIVKVPLAELKLLVGEYKAADAKRDWRIVIEESDGQLYGNDGGYRYRINPIGKDRFINPDDGATLVFNTKDKNAISFLIFDRITFNKVK